MKEEKNIVFLRNKYKLGIFDGLPVERIRTEKCINNLANCLGIERGMIVTDENDKLKILFKGWIKK